MLLLVVLTAALKSWRSVRELLTAVKLRWEPRSSPLLRPPAPTSRKSKLLLLLQTQANQLSPTVSTPNHAL